MGLTYFMAKSDVQTSLRLPEELRDRLAAAADKGGRGIGEEIRRRLEASFKSEPNSDDPKTGELLAGVARMAEFLARYYPQWHMDGFSFKAFKYATDKLIGIYQPKGEFVANPAAGARANDLFDEELTADNVGAMLVGVALGEMERIA